MIPAERAARVEEDQLQLVVQAVHDILHSQDLEESLMGVVQGVRAVLSDAASSAITLVDRDGFLDTETYRVHGPLAPIMNEVKPRNSGGVGAWVVENKQAVFEPDVSLSESDVHPAVRRNRASVGAYACLPLQSHQRVIGTLFVCFDHPFSFTPAVRNSLQSFSDLIAHTLELQRLRSETQRQHDLQQQSLYDISRQLRATWENRDPESLLEPTAGDILKQVKQIVGQREISASIYVYEGGHFKYLSAIGPRMTYMAEFPPREEGTAAYVMRTHQPLFVDDTDFMPFEAPPLSDEAKTAGIRAFANLPLLIGQADAEQTIVGILIINLEHPFAFDPHLRIMLRLFADRAAIAVQAARVQRRRLREQAALVKISGSVAEGNDQEAGEQILNSAIELTEADYGSFWRLDRKRNELRLVSFQKPNDEWPQPTVSLPLSGKSINGHVIKSGEEWYSADVSKDDHHLPHDVRTRSAFCLPLLAHDELIGTLYFASEKVHGFSEDHREFLRKLGSHAATALYNAKLLEDEITQRKRADVLQHIAAQVREVLSRIDFRGNHTLSDQLRPVGSVILEQLQSVIPCTTASLQLVRGDQRTLFGAMGFAIEDADPYFVRPISEDSLAAEVMSTDGPIVISNVSADDRFSKRLAKVGSWCGVRLMAGEKAIGLLTIDHQDTDMYDLQEHGQLLISFANHAGLAIHDAQQRRSLLVLNESVLALSRSELGEPDQVFEELVKAVIRALDCDYCTVFVCGVDGLLRPRRFGDILFADPPTLTFSPGQGFAGWVFQEGKPLLVPNTHADDRYQRNLSSVEGPRSMVLAPLQRGVKIVGVISADLGRPGAFDRADLDILITLANHASVVLENIASLDDLAILNRIANDLSRPLSMVGIYERAAESATQALHCSHSTFFEFDRQVGELMPRARLGGTSSLEQARSFAPGVGIAGWVFANDKPHKCNDAFRDTKFVEGNNSAGSTKPRSVIAAPVRIENRVYGVLTADKDELNGFSDQDLKTLETIAFNVGVAIDRRLNTDALEVINKLQRRISQLQPVPEQLSEVYRAIADAMKGIMDTQNLYIALYDSRRDVISFPLAFQDGQPISDDLRKAGQPYSPRQLGDRNGLTEWVINNKQPLLIKRDFNQWIDQHRVLAFSKMRTRCWLGTPLILGHNVLGIIGMQNFQLEAVFDESHEQWLQTIAGIAAVAIENALQYQRRVDELLAIGKFQETINSLGMLPD